MIIWPIDNSCDVAIIDDKNNNEYYTYLPLNEKATNWNLNKIYFKTPEEAFTYYLANYVEE